MRAVGRGGLGLDFRLSDHVSLGLEGSANVLSDKYNSKKAGNADWYFNVMAGITINLGKTKNVKRAAAPVLPPQPQPQPEVKEEEPAPAPQPKPEVKPIRRDVLKENKDAKVEITGYADAGTGTKAINERLSEQRASAVKKALTTEYGIDASRVSVSHKGSTVQPFSQNDMNRVSICVTK